MDSRTGPRKVSHIPATPLPWRVVKAARQSKKDRLGRETNTLDVFINGANGQGSIAKLYVGHLCDDPEYIVHAANAYPRMLALIDRMAAALRANGAPNCEAMKEREALLRSLGEDA